MSSETTRKQIKELDRHINQQARKATVVVDILEQSCQAKLALVKALEIQERMEGAESVYSRAERWAESVKQDGSAGGGE